MEEERATIAEERERVEAVVREERPPTMIAGVSAVEAVGGAAAVILAILGLLQVFAVQMASIGVIAVGVALLIGGGTLAARFSRLLALSEARFAPSGTSEAIAGGMAMGTLFGAAGIVLGLLALLNNAPLILIPIASIVFGSAFLMASGATARMHELMVRGGAEPQRARRVASEAVSAASGTEVLVGLGGIVLGILAIAGYVPLILSLAAILGFGVTILIAGTSVASRMLRVFYR